jgi:hypothetical protein
VQYEKMALENKALMAEEAGEESEGWESCYTSEQNDEDHHDHEGECDDVPQLAGLEEQKEPI